MIDSKILNSFLKDKKQSKPKIAKTPRQKTRDYFRDRQGTSFDEVSFNRLWKSTTQHIRRLGKGIVNVSYEAYYHLTNKGESILDYTYSVGGAKGRKEEIREHFKIKLTTNRTANFIAEHGNKIVDKKRMKTWLKEFQEGKITKDEYYNKIELFKSTNKKYLSQGSK